MEIYNAPDFADKIKVIATTNLRSFVFVGARKDARMEMGPSVCAQRIPIWSQWIDSFHNNGLIRCSSLSNCELSYFSRHTEVMFPTSSQCVLLFLLGRTLKLTAAHSLKLTLRLTISFAPSLRNCEFCFITGRSTLGFLLLLLLTVRWQLHRTYIWIQPPLMKCCSLPFDAY